MTNTRKPEPKGGAEQMHRIVDSTMRAHFLVMRTMRRTRARTCREFYGFRDSDVIMMHFQKQGLGSGLWFRLKDGRVIDSVGRPSHRFRSWYVGRSLTPAKIKRLGRLAKNSEVPTVR
jgi:hypothetical protein